MKNSIEVIMLPTEDKSVLYLFKKGNGNIDSLHIGEFNTCDKRDELRINQHTYITVSQNVEPIKEGDCAYDEQTESIYRVGKFTSKAGHESHAITPLKSDVKKGETYTYMGIRYSQYSRKIIATDDPKLVYNHRKVHDVQAVSMESSYHKPIPQVQQSFLKEFVANPNGKYEVEYEYDCERHSELEGTPIIEEWSWLKLNQDNTVNITSVKEKMYSKTDVMLHFYNLAGYIAFKNNITVDGESITNWIKKNL
jgi:hypothetical protein